MTALRSKHVIPFDIYFLIYFLTSFGMVFCSRFFLYLCIIQELFALQCNEEAGLQERTFFDRLAKCF